uniref:Uncharacterized protein n=1 Tax=Timema tahoe TaxID=61484 RepID=A0A7R9ICT5_9NEOP|nr:unnamed protein product [Timema tahoe]
MSWQTVPTPLMDPSETMGDNSCQPPLTPVPIGSNSTPWLIRLQNYTSKSNNLHRNDSDVISKSPETRVRVAMSSRTEPLSQSQQCATICAGTNKRAALRTHIRVEKIRTSVRPSDLLTEQLEWGQPVELSLPCEEHCLSSRWSAKPPTASARASAFSWSELATPLRPTIGGLGTGTHIKFLVMRHRDLSCTHRLSILSSQTLFRWPSSTGSLEICQAFLSRFFSRTCLRIESGKEACGALLGRCLGVEASSDPLMAEVMNSAPRSISAAVRKVGVGPNLSLNTFVNLSQLVRLRCCVQWITRHGRLREHKVWSGPGSREGGWHGRCKCGEKVNSEAQQSRIWVDGALSEWFGIEQGVNNPFIYDQFIQSIPLAIPQQNIPSGVLATTSGWGAIDKMCLFCDDEGNDKEALVSAQTLGCGPTTRSWAEELRDLKVLKKLTSLDLVTLEAKYHKKCYVSLQNHACTNKQKWEPQRENKRLNNMDILFKNMNSLLQSAKEDAQKKLKDQYAMQRREGQLIIGPI